MKRLILFMVMVCMVNVVYAEKAYLDLNVDIENNTVTFYSGDSEKNTFHCTIDEEYSLLIPTDIPTKNDELLTLSSDNRKFNNRIEELEDEVVLLTDENAICTENYYTEKAKNNELVSDGIKTKNCDEIIEQIKTANDREVNQLKDELKIRNIALTATGITLFIICVLFFSYALFGKNK
ncbi:MAG: hypothetical protein U9O94_08515 [Nanoarchaeota archaeon]|nr:hypothetical protein [Nanoarchaeota archaeon]